MLLTFDSWYFLKQKKKLHKSEKKLRNHFIRSCKLKTMYKMIKNKYLFYQQSKYYSDFEQQ